MAVISIHSEKSVQTVSGLVDNVHVYFNEVELVEQVELMKQENFQKPQRQHGIQGNVNIQ